MLSSKTLFYKLGRWAICAYVQFLLRMDVLYETYLPPGPKLIVVNHPSTTDPFYLLTLFPQPLSILIIEHAFRAPIFGWILHRSGHIPVRAEDKRAAFDAAHLELRKGRSIAIFPEGDLSPRSGGSAPAHSGAARLALLTGVPVIPVGIYFKRDKAHPMEMKFGKHSETAYWYLHGPYSITIGKPMQFSGDVEDRPYVHSITEKIMEAIDSLAEASQRRMEEA